MRKSPSEMHAISKRGGLMDNKLGIALILLIFLAVAIGIIFAVKAALAKNISIFSGLF